MKFDIGKMEKILKKDPLLEFQYTLLRHEGKGHEEALKELYTNEILEDNLRGKTYLYI